MGKGPSYFSDKSYFRHNPNSYFSRHNNQGCSRGKGGKGPIYSHNNPSIMNVSSLKKDQIRNPTLSLERDQGIRESDMWKMYRFAEKAEEVNWNARYQPDYRLLRAVLPHMLDYTEESIKKVTFEEKNLRAVIGLSGGLDSCVSSLLVANSISRGIKRGSSDNGNLVLITFNGMSQEDLENGKRFGEDLKRKFSEVNIKYDERDIKAFDGGSP